MPRLRSLVLSDGRQLQIFRTYGAGGSSGGARLCEPQHIRTLRDASNDFASRPTVEAAAGHRPALRLQRRLFLNRSSSFVRAHREEIYQRGLAVKFFRLFLPVGNSLQRF